MILQVRGRLGNVDARVKILWLLATLVAGLVFVHPVSLIVILASIATVALIGGVLAETIRSMRGLAVIIIVIGLIFGITVAGQPLFYLIPALGSFGPAVPISREGVFLGFISILRMFVFAAPIVVVIMTTNNSDLLQGLMYFRLPMEFALMIVLALNFVPIVLAEFGRIADAQKARAHALIEKGFLGRARGLVPIFIPLTLNAVDRADTVGKVLEIRGFARRQFQVEFEDLSRASWALFLTSLGLIGLAVASAVLGQDLFLLIFNLARF
ncbi:MAG: energy-coupling factor transporter transmembrane component T family protein [Anaerolineae bacterium]